MKHKSKGKVAKLVVAVLFMAVMLLGTVSITGCMQDRSHNYTIAEHTQNISERVQRRYIDTGEFESFEIYPIFLPNGAFADFLLVEFAPVGFMYVRIDYDTIVGGGAWLCRFY